MLPQISISNTPERLDSKASFIAAVKTRYGAKHPSRKNSTKSHGNMSTCNTADTSVLNKTFNFTASPNTKRKLKISSQNKLKGQIGQ